ncbi:MAG: alkaline phosphatase family protein [Opitutaceae bacterium]|nr:alkaline phosphatase family protein [Opitutaceae bacterium]
MLACVWSIVLSGCVLSAAAVDRHVVVISLDGVPASMFWEPRESVPTLRRLAKAGVAAEGMVPINPSFTWPNHATLMTGVGADRHGLLYNGALVRDDETGLASVRSQATREELVRGPLLFDAFHQAGLTTAAINWPGTLGAESIDDNFPDVPSGYDDMTPRLKRELIETGVIRDLGGNHFKTASAPARDEVWLEAACHVIRTRRPHLLMLHLLNTDGTNHRYGAGSYASQSALALADSHVARVLRAIEEAGIADRTTVFVLSDHGFGPTAKWIVSPNVWLHEAGWLDVSDQGEPLRGRAFVLGQGGNGGVFLTPSSAAAREEVRGVLRGKEGIADVLSAEDLAGLGWPRAGEHPGVPDLLVVPAEGYAIAYREGRAQAVVPVTPGINPGYHGHLVGGREMEAMFVAAGPDIRIGDTIGRVRNVDVAPTIARVMGITLPWAEGRALDVFVEPGEQPSLSR